MIKIGKRIISKDSRPLIIAEIGINHFGSLKIAKKLVNAAKKNELLLIKNGSYSKNIVEKNEIVEFAKMPT